MDTNERKTIRCYNIKWDVTPGSMSGYWYHGYKDDVWVEVPAEELPRELTYSNWDGLDPKTLIENEYPPTISFDVEVTQGASVEAEAHALFKKKVYDRVRAVVGHLPQDDQLRLAVTAVVGEEVTQ